MIELDAIAVKLQTLEDARPLPAEIVEQLADWYELELTFTGLALDGGQLSRDQTALILDRDPASMQPSLPEHQAAINLRNALRRVGALTYGSGSINESTIQDLHRQLRRGLDPNAGRYRRGPLIASVDLGATEQGRATILPHHSRLPSLMAGLGTWLETLEPNPEMALEAHYRLIRIMPFADANHAVARLVMNLVLGRAGLPPIIIDPEQRDDYLDSLEVALIQGDKGDWRSFMLDLLDQSLDVCLIAAARAIAPRVAAASAQNPD